MGPNFGPERLPHRRLEQRGSPVCGTSESRPPLTTFSAVSQARCWAGPLDAIGSTRLDIARVHSRGVICAQAISAGATLLRSGHKRTSPPMPKAALARSLDSSDFDLTAEVLLATWPMLRPDVEPSCPTRIRYRRPQEDRLWLSARIGVRSRTLLCRGGRGAVAFRALYLVHTPLTPWASCVRQR